MSGDDTSKKSGQLVWSVIILHMLNHVISGSMPMLYPDLMDEFDISYAELGLIRSAAGLAAGVPQMFVGLFRRWFSARVLISGGNLLNALMNIGISMGNGFAQFMGFSVLAGVGNSVQHPLGASIVSNGADPKDRGRMLGLNQAVPSIAFAFTPLLTAYLLTRMGWRSTLGVLSIPALALSVVILFFIKGSSDVEGKSRDALNLGKLREQLKNRNVLSISVLRSVMAFRMGVRTFLPLYFIDILGFSSERSSLLYAVMLGGGVLGPFFWGWLSDRMNRKPLIIGIMTASAVGYFMLNYVTSYTGLAVLLFFIGFMVQTVIVQSVMTDSVERSQLDQIFGLYFTIGFTIASISSALFGWVVETYGFNMGFSYIAVVSAISLLPAFFIQEPRNLPQ
ncbi:MFS transporter [Candidatus Bathyarchaeota archaeon]|jgi:MFS transporter, FSR family, fosmidomycin resistance protein|nr:MFS transporter [Candidatus Bathyarchaeota archaeon]MBT4320489.1 MFS transporter [Candidatus Bathyarchaeota archaeon]MBT4424923.1 MFS transporter [Candidatus Bathyarchaeota archaeon]MBT6604506.1 MFS transporter [Candidatus Bathyarchaeota archaeon]MBT7186901.1 MFS transporter [Candidatus Bathyarchaeota archaeon]